MSKPLHWGQALTAIGLVGALAACSNPMSRAQSASVVDSSKVGLALRAHAALTTNDLTTALSLAESAVEYRPQDASFRALLGNVYLASGRFASAEAAYRDSLSLQRGQPQLVLKLALVQIAQGRDDEASALLASARSMIDAADLGLALALAGRTEQAVAVLEPAARAVGADARTRQNLALAYALAGDWQAARTIAAQDLPADQLDARIDQWMALAKPGQSGTKVAAFIGITPAAVDPGQPVRLALNPAAEPTRMAEAPAVPAPVAIVRPAETVEVPVVIEADVEAPAIAAVEAYVPAAPVVAAEAPKPVVEPVAVSAPREVAAIRAPRPALTPAAVRLSQSLPEIRRAAMPRAASGRSKAVVQLGAYSSRGSITTAWQRAAAKYGALKGYTPVTARFDGARGTVYRLGVKGFSSDRQAIALCVSYKRAGGNCFVRATSGDAPVRLASR